MYGYAVHRRCARMLGNPSDADDALQNVFVRVMRYGHTFDGRDPLGWLYRIADRHCIDVIRKGRRVELVGEWGRRNREPSVDNPSTGSLLLGLAVRRIVRSARPKDSRIAILYYLDGMTQDEVAREMGCSRKTVKKRLARFKELVRRMRDPDAPDRREKS